MDDYANAMTALVEKNERLQRRIAELEAAQAQAVPDKLSVKDDAPIECINGWNNCRQAMLTAAPTPAGSQQNQNCVTLDKRDLFDFVRGAIKDALTTDDNMHEQAELWSDASSRTIDCLSKLYENPQPPAANAAHDVRNQALEEAAKLIEEQPCECCWPENAVSIAEDFAEQIRALKTPAKREG